MLNKLIIFMRYPEPGKVKTRLIPRLGADAAARLQYNMSQYTLDQARALLADCEIEIRYTGADEMFMREWLGDDLVYKKQGEGDLGVRIARAVEASLKSFQKVVIIGSDCPEINTDLLRRVFGELENNDLVVGPAYDGGYYLLGLKKSNPALFEDIPWGGNKVLEKTITIAKTLNLQVHFLKKLYDVDLPEDIEIYKNVFSRQSGSAPQVTIIIPTLNEEENIKRCLFHIPNIPGLEIILVDGGSTDETVNLARKFPNVTVIKDIPGGRSNQMNVGAIFARGEALLFLHADTMLPMNFLKHVNLILANADNVAGAFCLFIEGSRLALVLVEKLANLRSRMFQMPYGDQAIFLRKDLFNEIGGYVDLPIMEDFELIMRLRPLGKIVISRLRVRTLARRWNRLGIIRTTLINQFAVISYFWGASPEFIARVYRRKILLRDLIKSGIGQLLPLSWRAKTD